MLHGRLVLLLRKALYRKFLLLLLLSSLIFYLHLNGSFKRNREGQPHSQWSWSQNEESLGIASRQHLRRERIANQCHSRHINNILPEGSESKAVSRQVFQEVMVNDKYRFLYCQVPKIATSNWKRVFMVLNGNATNPWQIRSVDAHNKTRKYFRYLHEYTPSEIVERLNTYYKFLFVRHPFERLASAYRNKFVESNNSDYFPRVYGRYIIKKFRKREKFLDMKTISFQEFVQYVLEDSDELMNDHWRLYDDLCRPCLIYYDFIGHFEELERDSNDILRILDVSEKVSFPRNISSGYVVPSSVLVQKYFAKLPKSFKDRLYRKYQRDFEMFGYKVPKH